MPLVIPLDDIAIDRLCRIDLNLIPPFIEQMLAEFLQFRNRRLAQVGVAEVLFARVIALKFIQRERLLAFLDRGNNVLLFGVDARARPRTWTRSVSGPR